MRPHYFLIVAILGFSLIVLGLSPVSAETPSVEWIRQFGTSDVDVAKSISVDAAGNAYVTGYTSELSSSDDYAFLTKYDTCGTKLWAKQFGVSHTKAYGVSVDAGGNAYITGWTDAGLDGPFAGGGWDGFIIKYSADGTALWTRQIGTGETEHTLGVSVDAAGNAYITGHTSGSLDGPNAGSQDAFLARYDAGGTKLWTRQFGTGSSDEAFGVSVDTGGNAYVTGYTYGNLGGTNAGTRDAFLTKYDASGTWQWNAQLGTSTHDEAYGVSVDADGNAYITGWTVGNLDGPNAGGSDAFLAKYDSGGTELWTRQLATSGQDAAYGVSVDANGNAYITGHTTGSFGGPADGRDAFLAKYDAGGTAIWTTQFGISGSTEEPFGVSVDAAGNAYITGWTGGSFGGPTLGSDDAFIAKIIPEPATLSLLLLGGLALIGKKKVS